MTDFLLLATVFLVAGVLAVPIATRLGLGSVLGFLIAGVVISPILTFLNVDIVAIQHFAEFGVVMMLFLVGLELEPKMLWQMRNRLLGLGGLQVGLTTLIVMGVAMAIGLQWSVALACGLILALSSTAIVLQTLNEKGLMRSDGGQASFSVLLFQDIAVIPMLALIPLLALPELMPDAVAAVGEALSNGAAPHGEAANAAANHAADAAHAADGDHGAGFSLVEGKPGWQVTLITLGAIAGVVVTGMFLTSPVFRYISGSDMRELFVAAALMFVIGIALLMTLVGLSPALGTFIAGVVLANSEYRHELESDIDPFRGLLLGLFFMTVGAAINFDLLFAQFGTILGLTLALMLAKAVVLLVLARIFNVTGSDKWLFGLGLAQAGEFGFVLISFTVANYVLPQSVADQLLLIVALSMMLTPALFILYDKVIAPIYDRGEEMEPEEIESSGSAIVAGHGRFGGIVNHMLLAAGYQTTVLDYSAGQLGMLRRFGIKVFYGDATRADLLESAGVAEAKVFVIAIDQLDPAIELTRYLRKHYPDLHIVARALNRHHVYDLYEAGANDIIRDTFDSAVRAGRSAWEGMGMHPFDAEMMARAFAHDDRVMMAQLASVYSREAITDENSPYAKAVRELTKEREAQLTGKGQAFRDRNDRGWSPPTIDDLTAEVDSDASPKE